MAGPWLYNFVPKESIIVLLVIDASYEEELGDDGRVDHYWLVGTPHNKAIAADLRLRATKDGAEKTVTTFNYDSADHPEKTCDGILDVIDTHLGQFASAGTYSEVEVRGATLSSHLRSRLKKLGFGRFSQTRRGFQAVR